jgi:NADH-quinone oxidoreductase subunit C
MTDFESQTTVKAPGLLEKLLTRGVDDADLFIAKDGIEGVVVPAARFEDAAAIVRDAGFVRFIDLTCVDRVERPQHEAARFEIQLLVYSMKESRWARLVTRTADKLPSLCGVYLAAFNYEREVFDLYGVVFTGHPQLTRLMLPEGWSGHPLRRDEQVAQEAVDFTVTRDLYKT